jgi:hypothetical protein
VISTGRDPEEIDDGDLVLIRFSKPTVIGCIRILAHEGVVNRLIALEDLAMHRALVIIPNLAARLREYCLDR